MQHPRHTQSVSVRHVLLVFAVCSGASPSLTTATTVDVQVINNRFVPETLTIQKGDTVRWKGDSSDHTVTSGAACTADGRFDFSLSGAGSTASFTYNQAGSFLYFCRPHCGYGMAAKVVVKDSSPPPPVINPPPIKPPRPVVRLPDPIHAPIAAGAVSVKLQPIASGLAAPNAGVAAPGHPDRLFVTDQAGLLWAIDLANGQKSVFLDVQALLIPLGIQGPGSYDERGLLGAAFHPDYLTNGLFYTFTSEPANGQADFATLPAGATANHHGVVREWRVPAQTNRDAVADPASSRVVLRIEEPQFNHNGGGLAFGKDGLLYISTGDGGAADDQGPGHSAEGNGQDRSNVLGKILRIDPNQRTATNGQYGIPNSNPFVPRKGRPAGGQPGCADGVCDEIYAYGFRNPFRFSFDLARKDLWAGDVGQNNIEEVDLVKAGGNYGWPLKEGSFCFDANGDSPGFVTNAKGCGPGLLREPVAQYDHDEGIAILGGFIYRGAALPALKGRYVFGDFVRKFGQNNGRLFYLNSKTVASAGSRKQSRILELKPSGQQLELTLMGFGQDAAGELYVLGNRTSVPSGSTGVVLKLVP